MVGVCTAFILTLERNAQAVPQSVSSCALSASWLPACGHLAWMLLSICVSSEPVRTSRVMTISGTSQTTSYHRETLSKTFKRLLPFTRFSLTTSLPCFSPCSPPSLSAYSEFCVASLAQIQLKKWYTIYKDHITLADYEIHDVSGPSSCVLYLNAEMTPAMISVFGTFLYNPTSRDCRACLWRCTKRATLQCTAPSQVQVRAASTVRVVRTLLSTDGTARLGSPDEAGPVRSVCSSACAGLNSRCL